MKNKKFIIIAASLLIILVMLIVTFLYAPIWGSSKAKEFSIKKGASSKKVALILKDNNVFPFPNLFLASATLLGYSRNLNSGDYLITEKSSLLGIFKTLKEGKGAKVIVTIIEGLTAKQIFEELKKSKLQNDGNYQIYFTDKNFINSVNLPQEAKNLEGFLFPETYHFSRFSNEKQILKKMIATFQLRAAEQLNNAKDTKLSFYELLTMASIIEKETSKDNEKAKIASVFYNRLKRGYKLQTDPTVIYGIKNFNGNLTKKDLITPSPYNSYLNKGLPPTPISNPGLVAIKAATNPAKTKYLYFVGKGDGTSYFSKNLKEHNRVVRKYQKTRQKEYRSY